MFHVSISLVIMKGKRSGSPSHCLRVCVVLRTELFKEIFCTHLQDLLSRAISHSQSKRR